MEPGARVGRGRVPALERRVAAGEPCHETLQGLHCTQKKKNRNRSNTRGRRSERASDFIEQGVGGSEGARAYLRRWGGRRRGGTAGGRGAGGGAAARPSIGVRLGEEEEEEEEARGAWPWRGGSLPPSSLVRGCAVWAAAVDWWWSGRGDTGAAETGDFAVADAGE